MKYCQSAPTPTQYLLNITKLGGESINFLNNIKEEICEKLYLHDTRYTNNNAIIEVTFGLGHLNCGIQTGEPGHGI